MARDVDDPALFAQAVLLPLGQELGVAGGDGLARRPGRTDLRGVGALRDLGAVMALIMLSILPIIIFYLFCQKYIIKGVADGAVKG